MRALLLSLAALILMAFPALAEQSLKRLFAGYRNGSVDYLAILDAQQSTSQLRRNLVNAEQQLVGFRIALYRALSGSIPETTTAAEQS